MTAAFQRLDTANRLSGAVSSNSCREDTWMASRSRGDAVQGAGSGSPWLMRPARRGGFVEFPEGPTPARGVAVEPVD